MCTSRTDVPCGGVIASARASETDSDSDGVGSACDNQGDEHVMTVSNYDAATGVYTGTQEPSC